MNGTTAMCRSRVLDIDRDCHTEARIILCELLERFHRTYHPTDFPLHQHHAPMIEEKLYLSISHTAAMVAAAVSERPIGIDVQASRPITPRLLLEYAECCELPGMDGIELWSAIESVAKTGLTTVGKARKAMRITKDNQVLVYGEHASELVIIRFAHGAPDGTVLSLFRQY